MIQKLKNKIKKRFHYETIGEPADAFWIAHAYFRDAGKIIGMKPKENLLLQTEEWLERKTHEHQSHSGMRKMMLETKALKSKKDGILDESNVRINELKRRLKKFQY